MKRYYFVDDATSKRSNMDVVGFNTLEEALNEADNVWAHLTKRERTERDAFYVGAGEEVEEGEIPEIYEIIKDYKEEEV